MDEVYCYYCYGITGDDIFISVGLLLLLLLFMLLLYEGTICIGVNVRAETGGTVVDIGAIVKGVSVGLECYNGGINGGICVSVNLLDFVGVDIGINVGAKFGGGLMTAVIGVGVTTGLNYGNVVSEG